MLILITLLYFYLGGRGHDVEVWPFVSYNVADVKNKYNKTYPVPVIKHTSYTEQQIYSRVNYLPLRYNSIAARVTGFIRPPQDGFYHIMINADDLSLLEISDSPSNMSTTKMVSIMSFYNYSLYQSFYIESYVREK